MCFAVLQDWRKGDILEDGIFEEWEINVWLGICGEEARVSSDTERFPVLTWFINQFIRDNAPELRWTSVRLTRNPQNFWGLDGCSKVEDCGLKASRAKDRWSDRFQVWLVKAFTWKGGTIVTKEARGDLETLNFKLDEGQSGLGKEEGRGVEAPVSRVVHSGERVMWEVDFPPCMRKRRIGRKVC